MTDPHEITDNASTDSTVTPDDDLTAFDGKQVSTDGDAQADSPTDVKGAARSVNADDKRRAFILLGAAGVTLGVLFLSRLIWLFKPLLDLVYYGTLSIVLYYIALVVIFTVYVIFLQRYVKKNCDYSLLSPKKDTGLTVPHALGVIALGAAVVLCISAGFKFKVKIQVEMGSGVTMATALINLSVYIYYGLHLWLGLIAAALTDRALSALLPTRYRIPWGAILLVTVFGLIEFALEFGTTDHMYPWLYYLLTYVYAAIYELTKRSFHLTYWACIVIMVL